MDPAPPDDEVEAVLTPSERSLGDEVVVRRALPAAQRQMVGPFIFFDEFGPLQLASGRGLDVRPHPHIGLATVTYLFEGSLLHRDSLGTVQTILPGAVNWMTAGRGIVHSERTPPEVRHAPSRLAGAQVWVALPEGAEEVEPAFAHHPAAALPLIEEAGVSLRLIIGRWRGARSPVVTHSETFYCAATLEPGAVLRVSTEHAERAAYLVEGAVEVSTGLVRRGALALLRRGAEVALRACEPTRLFLLGGEPLTRRHLYWNFVSSSKERIEQAKADWREGRFAAVPGETERIPLPG